MKIFEHIEGLVSNKIAVIKTVASIFKLEARLARLSVFPLILNIILLFTVLLTLWILLIFLAGYYFTYIFDSIVGAVSLVLLLNIGVFAGLLAYLRYNLTKMSFQKTRKYFSKEDKSGHLKSKISHHQAIEGSGKKIALTRKKGWRS